MKILTKKEKKYLLEHDDIFITQNKCIHKWVGWKKWTIDEIVPTLERRMRFCCICTKREDQYRKK